MTEHLIGRLSSLVERPWFWPFATLSFFLLLKVLFL